MSAPKADNLPLPPLPDQRYDKLSIDPPWHFRSRAASLNPDNIRSPQKHYPTMDLAHIKKLPVRAIAKPDAHVFLWMTGPLLVQGVHSMLFDAWGVEASSMAFVWIKTGRNFEMGQLQRTPLLEEDLHFGMGFTTRQNAEYVVLGRIGSPSRARADIRQVIVAPVSEHSRKPDEYYRRVEHYAHGSNIDMFAGADRPGWTRWGWGHREGEGERCVDLAGEAA
jgi:N6-adenosine-specific RNA methylase IME4